jgi:hypothetical protein
VTGATTKDGTSKRSAYVLVAFVVTHWQKQRRNWRDRRYAFVVRISRVRRYVMAETAKELDQWEQGRGKGDQSHLNEDHVYVVVAFVVTFVAIEVVLMEEAGDWRGRKDIVYRVRVCRTY